MTIQNLNITVATTLALCFMFFGILGISKLKIIIFSILIPIIISASIYYIPPLIQHKDLSEYNTWAMLFIAKWSLIGFLGALIGGGLGTFIKGTSRANQQR